MCMALSPDETRSMRTKNGRRAVAARFAPRAASAGYAVSPASAVMGLSTLLMGNISSYTHTRIFERKRKCFTERSALYAIFTVILRAEIC